MISLAIVAVPAINIACVPTAISAAEAKALAIDAARVHVARRFVLDAEITGNGLANAYSFRVFAVNADPKTVSNMAGWLSVNKYTAALTDLVLDDAPVEIATVRGEQGRLRMAHGLMEESTRP